MSMHLNPGDEDRAVLMLASWDKPLKWNAFLETFATATGKSVTRQAVHKSHPAIVEAFKEAKTRLRKGSANRPYRDNSDGALQWRDKLIEQQKSRIKQLEQENSRLLERFKQWQYNADASGLTPEELDRPLPVPNSRK